MYINYIISVSLWNTVFFIYRGFIAQYNGHADLEMRRLTALE